MKPIEIVAQIIGAAAVAVYIMLYRSSDMKKVLKKKRLMDILWAVHYLLIGAPAAVITNSTNILRETVFINRDRVKIFASKLWLFVFLAIMWTGIILTWNDDWFSLAPAVASTIAIFSFWQKSVPVARVCGIIINCLSFSYNLHVMSYMGIVAEVLCFISTMSAIFLEKREAKNKKEVG